MQRPSPWRGLLALALVACAEGASASLGARSALLAREVARKIRLRKQPQNARVEWNYEQHGSNWPGVCLNDQHQSPVGLPPLSAVQNSSGNLWYRYKDFEEPVAVYNDGLSLSVTFHEKVGGVGVGPSFTGLDASWSLAQMTIHAPSEHTWAGSHLPLELQMVHTPKETGGPLAIVAIGFSRGPTDEPNRFWDTLLKNGLPKFDGDTVQTNLHFGESLNFNDLMADSEFLSYQGSVTQPPCTPNVKWFVRDMPIPMIPQNLDAVMENIQRTNALPDGNYRVLQQLNNRTIERYTAVDSAGMPTLEDVSRKAMALGPPTASPSVPIPREERDPDNEDATAETEDAKLSWRYSDPVGDHIKAEKEKADSQNDIMNAYNHSFIINNEDDIIAEMPDVIGAQGEMDAAAVEKNEAQALCDKANQALILAKQGRDFAEGRTNLTEAEAIYMSALDEVKSKQSVVDALTGKVNAAKAKLDEAKGTGHAQVWWAQNQIKRMGDSVPQLGPLEPMVPMSSQLPSGPYTDPFSASDAELVPRVGARQQPQYLTQALGPNHPYITGTVEVGANTEEESVVEPQETDVLAPTEREPTIVEG